MILKKVKHNVFDVFVGSGWNNHARIQLSNAPVGTKPDITVIGGNTKLTRQQADAIANRFMKKDGHAEAHRTVH